MRHNTKSRLSLPGSLVLAGTVLVSPGLHAREVIDSHGNVGFTSAAECDAAVHAGEARFYRSFTDHPPLMRDGEADVKVMRLGDIPGYEKGACDQGVGRRFGRDGVSSALVGTFIPFGPDMDVNAYFNASGKMVRLMMKRCDNNFSGPMPRPVAEPRVSSDCYADVLIPARFETVTNKVEVEPATVRHVPVPATYRTVTEEVMVQAEIVRQIPIPATYKTVTEEVLVKPESIRKEPVPPTYKTTTEEVVIKPESTRIKVIPATYKTVTEQVLVKEADVRLVAYPAQFETITETVQVSEEHKVWKRGRAWIGQAIDVQPLRGFEVGPDGRARGTKVEKGWANADNYDLDDDVMCLVEVPAEYKTIQRQVLKSPAGVREVEIPAVYETVTRQVVDTPARTEEITIPAQYGTVERRVVATPASTRDVVVPAVYETITRTVVDQPASFREEVIPAQYETVTRKVIDQPATVREIPVPAKYRTLSHRVKVADARTERRQILCETNANRAKIMEIQRALKAAGFDPGPIDGILRSQTMAAVNRYQQANDLPVDGYLNMETVKALGVSDS